MREADWAGAHHFDLKGTIIEVKGTFKAPIKVKSDSGTEGIHVFENPATRGGPAAARPIKTKYKALLEEERVKVAKLEAIIAQLKAAEADDLETEALERMQTKATRRFKNLTVTTLKEIWAKWCPHEESPLQKTAIVTILVGKLFAD